MHHPGVRCLFARSSPGPSPTDVPLVPIPPLPLPRPGVRAPSVALRAHLPLELLRRGARRGVAPPSRATDVPRPAGSTQGMARLRPRRAGLPPLRCRPRPAPAGRPRLPRLLPTGCRGTTRAAAFRLSSIPPPHGLLHVRDDPRSPRPRTGHRGPSAAQGPDAGSGAAASPPSTPSLRHSQVGHGVRPGGRMVCHGPVRDSRSDTSHRPGPIPGRHRPRSLPSRHAVRRDRGRPSYVPAEDPTPTPSRTAFPLATAAGLGTVGAAAAASRSIPRSRRPATTPLRAHPDPRLGRPARPDRHGGPGRASARHRGSVGTSDPRRRVGDAATDVRLQGAPSVRPLCGGAFGGDDTELLGVRETARPSTDAPGPHVRLPVRPPSRPGRERGEEYPRPGAGPGLSFGATAEPAGSDARGEVASTSAGRPQGLPAEASDLVEPRTRDPARVGQRLLRAVNVSCYGFSRPLQALQKFARAGADGDCRGSIC